MKRLLLLRHGKSDWSGAGVADHDRPLKARGKEAAKAIGDRLAREGLVPDLILSSTALRARKTAEKVAKASGCSLPIELCGRLYLAPPNVYLEVLRDRDFAGDCILVVGHNPGLENLLAHLTGSDEPMPTCALAEIKLALPGWKSLSSSSTGTLERFWTPKSLDGS